MRWIDRVILANPLWEWFLALGTFLLLLGMLWFAKRNLLVRLLALAQRTKSSWDDTLVTIISRSRLWLLVPGTLYLSSQALELPRGFSTALRGLTVVTLLVQIGLWFNELISQWVVIREKSRAAEQDTATHSVLVGLVFLFRLLAWSVIALLILDNLGVSITSLVASLGIGGIAVAIAAQNILGDLFASLSIVFDKPFLVGDFIIVDDQMGTIERVGLKTTHVRSLWGELIVFSNNDLLKSRIRNYKRMSERRVQFEIGVTYQTSMEQLERIPTMIRESVETAGGTRFDRAHFYKYGDFALVYQIVYYVLSPDYNVYMDIQQSINLHLFRRLAEGGIEFAYPTQTLLVHGPANGR